MMTPRTPRLAREERKADTSERLDELLRQHGVSQAAAALELGVGETMVAEWCKPEKPRSIPFADVLGLTEEVRLALAQDLVGAKYMIIEAPAVERADSIEAACTMMGEAAQLAQHCAESFKDGHVDRAEGANGYPLAMKVARRVLGAAELFKRAMREGVVGVRLVKGA